MSDRIQFGTDVMLYRCLHLNTYLFELFVSLTSLVVDHQYIPYILLIEIKLPMYEACLCLSAVLVSQFDISQETHRFLLLF